MAQYTDAVGNTIFTSNSVTPQTSAAVNPGVEPQSVPNSGGNTPVKVNISVSGQVLAAWANPA